jgi:branched-chain amino acid transport system ATP-binding protein
VSEPAAPSPSPPASPALPAPGAETLLQARDASIEFGGLKALQRFNLEIRQGDLKGLIGPNGAGKTTAFNVLTGVYRPTSGDIHVSGQRVNGKKPHQINRLGLARTFQNIRLFKALTALDNVRVACLAENRPLFSAGWLAGLRRAGGLYQLAASTLDNWNNYYDWWRALLLTPGFLREERELTRRADELLEVMGLSHRRDEEARNLPYGEQRRLEIARALGTQPRVLLLDEPAAGMNTREKADLMVLIRRLREQFSLGILVIEHDMKLVMGICEQITVLDHGETIAVGTPEGVRANRKVIEAYLGDSYLESHPEVGAQGASP